MPDHDTPSLNAATLDQSVLDNLNSLSKESVNRTLNAAVKDQLAAIATNNGSPELALLVQDMISLDIAANQDVPLKTLLASQAASAAGSNPKLKNMLDAALAKISGTATVREALKLDLPLERHPLFRAEARRAAILAVIAASPLLAEQPQLQRQFVNLYEENNTSPGFWNQLAREPGFQDPAVVKELQITMQLGALTKNNPGLVQAIRARMPINSLRDLVPLDADEWKSLIGQGAEAGTIRIPASIPGETLIEKIDAYARSILAELTSTFPTDYVAASITRSPSIDVSALQTLATHNPDVDLLQKMNQLDWGNLHEDTRSKARASLHVLKCEAAMFPGFDYDRALTAVKDEVGTPVLQNPVRQELTRFFQNAPEFDFRTTHIDTFFSEHAATSLDSITAPERLKRQLKRMQRIFQVAPDYQAMSTLMGEGLDSAHKIVNIPQETFVRQFQDRLGSEGAARQAYARANFINGTVNQIYVQISQALAGPLPRALGVTTPQIKAYPNLATLFGPMDLCDCEQCRSVYSLAAYLVDLLHTMLNTTPTTGTPSPLDVLLARRPDLEYIKLTCENTNTALPYVDLVNEILESYVVLGKLDQTTAKDTGDSTTEELNAEPQHTNPAAYDKLRQAVFPAAMPFNQPAALARVYLEQLGSSRDEMMRIVQNHSSPADLDIAAEYLSIAPEERDILLGTTNHVLADFYYDAGHQPPDLVAALTNVREFLKQAGISYVDLIELVKTRFVNPGAKMTLDEPADAEPCDLDQVTIKNLDLTALDRMHRFVRLWRKLEATMPELDKTFFALQATDITEDFLENMAQLRRLQARLNLSLDKCLTWWADIDTQGDHSLYKQVFLNRTVLNPDNPADPGRVFLPNPDGSVLTDATKTISAYAMPLLAALRISAAELDLIRQAAGLTGSNAPLSLHNVSALYRYAAFARAVKFSVKDFTELMALADTDFDPFRKPDNTAAFVDLADRVKKSGFTVTQLSYLYRHLFEPATHVAPPQETLLLLAKTLHDGLLGIADHYAIADDPTGERTRLRLSELFDSAVVDQTIQLLDATATYSVQFDSPTQVVMPADVADRASYDAPSKLLRFTGPMSTTDRDSLLANVLPVALRSDPNYKAAIANLCQLPRAFIADKLSGFLDVPDAIAKLVDNQPLTPGGPPLTTADKFSYVLAPLSNYLQSLGSHTLVQQTLGASLKLDSPLLDLLLQRLGSGHVLTACLALGTSGVSASYFSDPQLQTLLVSRIDQTILFNSNSSSSMPAGTASARWMGLITAPNRGTYKFFVRTDGAVRLWVGDGATPLMAVSAGQAKNEAASSAVELKGGQLYRLQLEVTELGNSTTVELRWKGDGVPKDVIPAAAIYPSSIFDAFVSAYILLQKAALVVTGLKLTATEVAYLLDHMADFSNLDLNLPVERNDPNAVDTAAVNLFKQWQRLCDLVALRNSLPQARASLIDLFDAASFAAGLPADDPRRALAEQDAWQKLIDATGWDGTLVKTLSGTSAFNLKVEDLKNEIWALRLQATVQLILRLRVAPDQLFRWATTPTDALQAQDIKRMVKAQYDDATWLPIAKPLNDRLRESQRDALVAYLLPRLEMADSNQLFEFLLIDVDMGACMPTSRVVQAIASVQLFVQRCLMNLEPKISPITLDPKLWLWMKRYRLWEANRKVFLYPENLLDPELRDDKSPFFKELQTELLQSDITPDTAETALLHYLEKLDQVSRLEVCGMYWQLETDATGHKIIDVLHVFGRTLATPHIYYYRQLRDQAVWTSWEKVNLDIVGDHLVPIIFNRRLYLFWPIFTPKVQLPTQLPSQGTPPQKYWEISLAWSEYKQGKWLTKQVSAAPDGVLRTNGSGNYIKLANEDLDRRHYVFRTELSDDVQPAGSNQPTPAQQLTVQCLYADDKVSPMPNGGQSQTATNVGSFSLNSYGTVVAMGSAPNQPSPILVPPGSRAEAMMFANRTTSKDEKKRPLALNSASETSPIGIFGTTPEEFEILYPHQYPGDFLLQDQDQFQPFFFQDGHHAYFVMPKNVPAPDPIAGRVATPFVIFYHPCVWTFIRALNAKGITGLLTLDNQRLTDKGFTFHDQYGHVSPKPNEPGPGYRVPLPYPEANVDFIFGGAYALYNWELFFHVPLLIASRLGKNQKFEDAQKWFHYIFDPTSPDPAPAPPDRTPEEWDRERYWKVLPFQLYEWDRITDLLEALGYTGSDPGQNEFKQEVIDQINSWLHNPFNPHAIARLRQVAYQKNLVMKYIDNLIAWGDNLFRQNTRETIQEAVQLYVLAADLLGPRPERIPPRGNGNQLPGLVATYFEMPDLTGAGVSRVDPQVAFEWNNNSPSPAHGPNGFSVRWTGKIEAPLDEMYVFYLRANDGVRLWVGNQLLIDQWHDQPSITEYSSANPVRLVAGEPQELKLEYYSIHGDSVVELSWSSATTPKQIIPVSQLHFEPTYHQLQPLLDSFSNAIVALENEFPFSTTEPIVSLNDTGGSSSTLNLGRVFYFGIPKNDKLLSYWDTVADRLTKIRQCMNIEGVVQEQPPFAPEIDLSLLVQGAAAGADLGSVLNDVNAATPYYRFNYMLQKVQELCGDLKALGSALLSALEKKDAEALSLLRSSHEIQLLNAARRVKEQQLDEAQRTREGLQNSKLVVQARFDYYDQIQPRNEFENEQVAQLGTSQDFQNVAQGIDIAAAIAHLVPDADAGSSGAASSPVAKARYGGTNIGSALTAASRVLSFIASTHSHQANMASIQGGWARRSDDWGLQKTLAQKERDQIDKQIEAAKKRETIADQELKNHDQQIANAMAVDDFLRNKYTNEDLYDWMLTQVTATYFQTYQLAYDMAKRAEKAFRFERGLTTSNFIQFGYWDSLKKGLLAGEQLSLALRQMEKAYLEQNKREYEITKQVSLMLLDPLALITLKETGQCYIALPEALFDVDYPGHYMRRIRSVSLTIPCVVGPYTSVNCTLTLLSNKTRISSSAQGEYAEQESDSRFVYNFVSQQSIATSHAQNDSGLFELNFRDERYLPFEGAGAISEWRLDLPRDCNAFDFETISDVIIKLSYTAREGGELMKKKAWSAASFPGPHPQKQSDPLGAVLEQDNLVRLYSAKHEFPSEWYRFLHPQDAAVGQGLSLDINQERFPFQFRGSEIHIGRVELFLKFKTDELTQKYREQGAALKVSLTPPGGQAVTDSLDSQTSFLNGVPHKLFDVGDQGLGVWTIAAAETDIASIATDLRRAVTVNGVTHQRLNADAIDDLWMVYHYVAK